MLVIVFTILPFQKRAVGFLQGALPQRRNFGVVELISLQFAMKSRSNMNHWAPTNRYLCAFVACLWAGAEEIVSYQCLQACGLSDNRLIRDKHPAPSVEPGAPPLGIYVDNVHAFGGKAGDAGQYIERIKTHFDGLNIPFEVDHVDGETHVESLGLCFSFTDRVRVRAKRERAWRLWAATRALLKRRRISGESLRLWLGHVNFHFLLARPLLSTLSACYKFAAAHMGRRFPMWNSVRGR